MGVLRASRIQLSWTPTADSDGSCVVQYRASISPCTAGYACASATWRPRDTEWPRASGITFRVPVGAHSGTPLGGGHRADRRICMSAGLRIAGHSAWDLFGRSACDVDEFVQHPVDGADADGEMSFTLF